MYRSFSWRTTMDQKMKRNLRYGSALAPVAIIGIIWGTLDYGTMESPFHYTLSMIGNRFPYRMEFILWGIITGSLFLYYMYYTFKLTGFKNRKAIHLLILSDVSLILCVIFPSLREELPFFYHLHTLNAGIFVGSLLLSILLFIAYLSKIDQRVSKRSLLALMMVVAGSVLSLFVFGKCGMFELIFIVSLAVFLMILNVWIRALEKQNKLDHHDEPAILNSNSPASSTAKSHKAS